MSLGENIFKFRTQKSMSQSDLADALDVSRQSVSKWENDQAVPDLEKLLKMRELFGITLDELVSGEITAKSAAPGNPGNLLELLSGIPTRKIVGTLLFACAFLLLLIPTAFGNWGTGIVLSVPFALCGLSWFLFQRHLGVWSAWALYLPFSLIPIEQYIRSDICLLIRMFIQLPLLICTVIAWRKEPLKESSKITWLLRVGYFLWFIWFSMWLGTLSMKTTELYTGFDMKHILQTLTFPLFSALATTTFRLQKEK